MHAIPIFQMTHANSNTAVCARAFNITVHIFTLSCLMIMVCMLVAKPRVYAQKGSKEVEF